MRVCSLFAISQVCQRNTLRHGSTLVGMAGLRHKERHRPPGWWQLNDSSTEMTDGSYIRTPQFHRLCDRCFQLGVAELAAHAEERNHGSRSTLASMFLVHQLPELVIAFGPAALCSPLRQRLRSAQRTGLAFEHFEIVFQIEDLLRPLITALVLRDPHTVLPELNHAGVDASWERVLRPQLIEDPLGGVPLLGRLALVFFQNGVDRA